MSILSEFSLSNFLSIYVSWIPNLSNNDWISWVFILAGAFFVITGAIGVLRLPHIFARLHGAGMIDTLGISLILIGLIFQADEWIVAVKLGLVIIFVFFTSPTTTFALARAALHGGVNPGSKKDAKSSKT